MDHREEENGVPDDNLTCAGCQVRLSFAVATLGLLACRVHVSSLGLGGGGDKAGEKGSEHLASWDRPYLPMHIHTHATYPSGPSSPPQIPTWGD